MTQKEGIDEKELEWDGEEKQDGEETAELHSVLWTIDASSYLVNHDASSLGDTTFSMNKQPHSESQGPCSPAVSGLHIAMKYGIWMIWASTLPF